jgi:hypothetical protein
LVAAAAISHGGNPKPRSTSSRLIRAQRSSVAAPRSPRRAAVATITRVLA